MSRSRPVPSGCAPRPDLSEQELDAMLRGAAGAAERRRRDRLRHGPPPDSTYHVCLDPNEARAIVQELRRMRKFLFELRSRGTATLTTEKPCSHLQAVFDEMEKQNVDTRYVGYDNDGVDLVCIACGLRADVERGGDDVSSVRE